MWESAGIMVLSLAALGANVEDRLPTSLDVSGLRAVAVQHDGRWMPLDTLARDMVEGVTGDAFYHGRDPVLWLLAWTFDPATWMQQPLITIHSAELRGELKLPTDREVFSFAELVNHAPLREQFALISQRPRSRKPSPLEAKVGDLSERLGQLQDIFAGEVMRPIPDPDRRSGTWQTVSGLQASSSPQHDAVLAAWQRVRSAFLAHDAAAFATASKAFADAVNTLPAAYRPSTRILAAELRYHNFRPYHRAWQAMVVGAVMALLALMTGRKWIEVIAVGGLVVGLGLLTYGLVLRWQIAGRLPASNMFESLLFLGWGAGAFAIVAMLLMHDRFVPMTASAIGALALLLADVLPLDHFIRPIAPVLLDTIWMSIHVPIIMISYAVLAIAMLIAHVQLIVMTTTPGRRELIHRIHMLHYWYIHVGTILLGAGIITGSMWAASSWGRYWGWDPKEVWSLIAFLAYLTILHIRVDAEKPSEWVYGVGLAVVAVTLMMACRQLAPLSWMEIGSLGVGVGAMAFFVLARGPFAMCLKSALAFWLIIMTYVGVNFVLGIGLHSYGFGAGAVVKYMFLCGGSDLALLALMTGIFAARRGWYAVAAAEPVASLNVPEPGANASHPAKAR